MSDDGAEPPARRRGPPGQFAFWVTTILAIVGVALTFVVVLYGDELACRDGRGWLCTTPDPQASGRSVTPEPGPVPMSPPAGPSPSPSPGRVPPELVGSWEGGPGDESGFRLRFNGDGTYRLERGFQADDSYYYEVGTAIVDGATMQMLVVDASIERPSVRVVQWELLESDIADVLAMTDAVDGYFSYVRTS